MPLKLEAEITWLGANNKVIKRDSSSLPVPDDFSFDDAISCYTSMMDKQLRDCPIPEVERIRSDLKLGQRYDVVWTVKDATA